MSWRKFGISQTGISHRREGTSCQDRHALSVVHDRWLVAVLGDGAGSTPYGGIGAELFVNFLHDVLVVFAEKQSQLENPNVEVIKQDLPNAIQLARLIVKEAAANSVDSVRDLLSYNWGREEISRVSEYFLGNNSFCGVSWLDNKSANNFLLRSQSGDGGWEVLKDYHTTLIGCILADDGGFFFHIGDGVACAMTEGDWLNAVVSHPENGEYSDESYFVTSQDWRSHLRFTDIQPYHDTILMMSDGGSPFIMAPKLMGPEILFFNPIHKFLKAADPSDFEASIRPIFERPELSEISQDDITFIWANRDVLQK